MASFGVSVSAGLGASASLGAGVSLGTRKDPLMGFNFLVEIEGLLVGGFTEISGLQIETEVESYREGGVNDFVHKLPGASRYPSNLILKRGIADNDTFWNWHQDVVHGNIERKNGTIYLLDAERQPAISWNFFGAYPVKWTGPDLRAESNTVAVETVELAHEGISRLGGISLSLGASLGVSAGASASLSLSGAISI
jgi:phage tail-like protein